MLRPYRASWRPRVATAILRQVATDVRDFTQSGPRGPDLTSLVAHWYFAVTRLLFPVAVLLSLLLLPSGIVTAADCLSPQRVLVFSGHAAALTWQDNTQGARSYSGVLEYTFNDKVTQLFTKKSSPEIEYIAIPATLNIPRRSRPELATLLKASVLLEIHHDSVQPHIFKRLRHAKAGTEIFDYYRGFCLLVFGDEQSTALAREIEASLIRADFRFSTYHSENIPSERMRLIPGTKATYQRKNLSILRTSPMPAVIVECGVTANPQEEILLNQEPYRQRMVDAIHEGISLYLARSQ